MRSRVDARYVLDASSWRSVAQLVQMVALTESLAAVTRRMARALEFSSKRWATPPRCQLWAHRLIRFVWWRERAKPIHHCRDCGFAAVRIERFDKCRARSRLPTGADRTRVRCIEDTRSRVAQACPRSVLGLEPRRRSKEQRRRGPSTGGGAASGVHGWSHRRVRRRDVRQGLPPHLLDPKHVPSRWIRREPAEPRATDRD
jgi:hypothetical protein